MALGIGTLGALSKDDGSATPWVGMSAAADSCDVVAALVWRDELGPAFTAITLALAVPASVGGWWAALSGA